MPSHSLDFEVFDADNHMYETREALTKFLPEEIRGADRLRRASGGRTKIVVKGLISDYIPNPTFDVVAAPGAQEEYFKHGNPDGKSIREILGDPISVSRRFASPLRGSSSWTSSVSTGR